MKQAKLFSLVAAVLLSATTAMATDVAQVTTSGGVTTNYSDIYDAFYDWEDGSTLKLLAAVEASYLYVYSGSKTLDLNGYGIKADEEETVLSVSSGATLTIIDSRPDTPHKYSQSFSYHNARFVSLNEASGTITVNGGYITGGVATDERGGGLHIDHANVVMTGGNIIGNNAGWGGGVYLVGGSFTMSGTAGILYNYSHGGWTSGGAAFIDGENATFTMNGGTIKGNIGDNSCGGIQFKTCHLIINDGLIEYNATKGQGGGLHTEGEPNSYLVLNGGTIQNNYAAGNGGGISSEKYLQMQGNPVVKDNTCGGTGNDLYLPTNKIIEITGAMTEGADVNVTMQTPGAFTTGYSTYNTEAPADFFTVNDGGYVPLLNASGEVGCAATQNISARKDPQNAGEYYSTYYNGDWNYRLPDGVEAYVAELDEAHLQLTRIAAGGQVIPANTAVILKADHQPFALTPTDAAPVSVENNNLLGVDAATSAPANCYVLSGHSTDNTIQGIGFYQFTGTLGAHKAYLLVASGSGAPARLRFVFNEENTATSIDATGQQPTTNSQKLIENGQLIIIRNGVRYNAQGQIVK